MNNLSPPGDTGKLLRETSIRRNRLLKFIECLNKDDVDIGMHGFLHRDSAPAPMQPSCEN